MDVTERRPGCEGLRTIVLVDAIFEIVLGVSLLAIALTGAYSTFDIPGYVPRAAIAAFAVVLLPVGALLWWMARPAHLTTDFVLALAGANVISGMAISLWLGWEVRSFNVAGFMVADAVATTLIVLGALEFVLLRRETRRLGRLTQA